MIIYLEYRIRNRLILLQRTVASYAPITDQAVPTSRAGHAAEVAHPGLDMEHSVHRGGEMRGDRLWDGNGGLRDSAYLPDSSSTMSSPPQKRRRAALACYSCRHRKSRVCNHDKCQSTHADRLAVQRRPALHTLPGPGLRVYL